MLIVLLLLLLLLLLLVLVLVLMAMMRGELLQGRRYLTCCCACAASRALALTHARSSTNIMTRLWRWSGGVKAVAIVASAVTAWRRFCTAATSPPV